MIAELEYDKLKKIRTGLRVSMVLNFVAILITINKLVTFEAMVILFILCIVLLTLPFFSLLVSIQIKKIEDAKVEKFSRIYNGNKLSKFTSYVDEELLTVIRIVKHHGRFMYPADFDYTGNLSLDEILNSEGQELFLQMYETLKGYGFHLSLSSRIDERVLRSGIERVIFEEEFPSGSYINTTPFFEIVELT